MTTPIGFLETSFTDDRNRNLRVFSKGIGPSVIILHEMPGMTTRCIQLANRLSTSFTVFLPLLFGEPGEDQSMLARMFSLRADFCLFQPSCTSPIVVWLRDFCCHVESNSAGKRVGLIGMCLTGSLVLSLLAYPGIAAPVMSQPALPLPIPGTAKQKYDLGVSADDLERARRRVYAENIQILGFRFSNDWICPKDRFDNLKATFPKHFEPYEIPSPNQRYRIGRGAHAVLTSEFCPEPEDHPVLLAYERLYAFLAWRLRD